MAPNLLNKTKVMLRSEFILARKVSLMALVSTLAILIVLFFRTSEDSGRLLGDYPLSMDALKFIYLLSLPVLALVFWFEPQIRTEFVYGKSLVIFLSGTLSFASVWLNAPRQAVRLISAPYSLWLVIVHVIFLASLAAWLAISDPFQPPGKRVQRYALLTVGVLGGILIALSVLSVGRYMEFDFPDEPDVASFATSYAATGTMTRTFAASAFGNPDPVAPYFYMVMGLWLRVAGTSLSALRMFPLLTGILAVLMTAVALWRVPSLTLLQRWLGLASMIAFTAFFRASHNIRYDIGLAVYGAAMLVCLVNFFSNQRQRWLFFAGLAAYIGLEAISTATLVFAATTGIVLGIYVTRHLSWRAMLAYILGGSIAVGVYLLAHLLPDPAANIQQLTRVLHSYQNSTGFLSRITLIGQIPGYFSRFSQILSPVELPFFGIVLIAVVRRGSSAARWIGTLAILGMALIIILNPAASYGYLALLAPFLAYLTASAFKTQAAVMIGVFVLLAALVSAPIHDMALEIDANLNQRTLDEVDLLTWRIPEGNTVVGDTIFWFTLEHNRNFIGWVGLETYAGAHQMTLAQALESQKPDYVICFSKDQSHCDLATKDQFESPIDFVITRGKYLLYKRRN